MTGRNDENEFFAIGLVSSKRGGGTQYSFSEDSSVGGSSYNHSGFGFIGIDRFKQIVTGLETKNSSEIRRASMIKLCRLNPSDMLDEVQNPLKSVIFDCLADSDPVLAEKAFAYTSKLLSNSNVGLTKSVFASFAEHVKSQISSKRAQQMLSYRDGVSIDSPFLSQLLAKFRLIKDFHLQVSKYWIRYPSESLMEIVITNTLNLLSVQIGGVTSKDKESINEILTPAHLIAFLDPVALWFKTWIHGAFSRVHLLEELAKNRNFVETTALECYKYYDFKSKAKVNDPLDVGDASKVTPRNTGSEITYRAKQVRCIQFVHAMNIMTHLLRFKKGRELFPIKDKSTGEVISIQMFLLKLLKFITNPVSVPAKNVKRVSGSEKHMDTAHLVKKLFKTLSYEELPCKECICSKAIVEVLMEPVVSWTEYAHGNITCTNLPGKTTMVYVAEILINMVSSEPGRCFFKSVSVKSPLVSTTSAKASQAKTVDMNPCEVLCDFTVRALRGEIKSGVFDSGNSEPIIESYIFLCRQLYNHHEEFQLMQCGDLASALSQAWHESLRNVDLTRTPTPTGGTEGPSGFRDQGAAKSSTQAMLTHSGSLSVRLDSNNDELKWQNVLVDNLLNFAATPKGLLLLLQSGAVDSCAHYMFGRYSKKLQVSRCEKFGYGVLVSRISGCAAGMRALKEAGFISLFVSEIWSNIESCPDDRKIAYPYVYPTDPIDQSCMKSFNSLMNVLSTFTAVYELFYRVEFPTKQKYSLRDVPEDIVDLINRVVMIADPVKVDSVFNVEQSHVFGLRLINSIFASLDSLLLFRTQYKVEEVLLDMQKGNLVEEEKPGGKSSYYVLDMPVVERNHVLIRMLTIGGSEERVLPPREVKKDCSDYNFPIFHKLPVPSLYIVQSSKSPAKTSSNELTKFLSNTQNWERDQKWLTNCTDIMLATVQNKQQIKGAHLANILEKALEARSKLNPDLLMSKQKPSVAQLATENLMPSESLAVKMIATYSTNLKILSCDQKESESSLTTTLKRVQSSLAAETRKADKNESEHKLVSASKFAESGRYPSMDWFAAVVHLMFGADSKRCCAFLSDYANVNESICIWPARGFMFHNGPKASTCELEPLMYIVGNNLELIVEKELPNIDSAFRMSGYSPALIAQFWLRQCFINILNWPDIVNYVLLSVVCGVDFAIYFCVAILKHLERDILTNSQQQTLLVYLKDLPVSGFKTSCYVDFMKKLKGKYRKLIQKNLNSVFK